MKMNTRPITTAASLAFCFLWPPCHALSATPEEEALKQRVAELEKTVADLRTREREQKDAASAKEAAAAKARVAAIPKVWNGIVGFAPFLQEVKGDADWNARLQASRAFVANADDAWLASQSVFDRVEIIARAAVWPLSLNKLKSVEAENKLLKAQIETLKDVVARSGKRRVDEVVTPKGNAQGWKDKANWRKLSKGMSKNAVIQILGEPTRVTSGGILDFFDYGDHLGQVQFSEAGVVYGWHEPY